MIRKLSYLLLLCLFSISGCQHAGPSEESFIKKYQQAHEKKDIDAALNLVHMQGVGEDIRQNLIGSFKDDFKLEIDKLEMVPVPKDQMTEYTAQGKTFKTNLDVKKVFIISFKHQAGPAQINNTKYLIGVVGDQYYITTAVVAQ